MRRIHLFTFLLVSAGWTDGANALKVYLWGGQSNGFRMASLAQSESAEASPHQIFFIKNASCTDEKRLEVDVEVITKSHPDRAAYLLGQSLVAHHQEDIAIIACQRCGRGVWSWDMENREGLYHQFFLPFVEEARRQLTGTYGQEWELEGIFWSHFEGDANTETDEHARRLPQRFLAILRDIKTRYSAGSGAFVPVIVNTVIPHEPDGDVVRNRFGDLVNQKLKELEGNEEVPYIHIVDASDIHHKPGDIHFSNRADERHGARDLATRMGKRMVEVLANR